VLTEVCSGGWAPYLLSWMLYQGTLLMAILNWAGLIINGLVAFMLPMILALKAIELKARLPHDIFLSVQAQAPVASVPQTSTFLSTADQPNEVVDVEGRHLPASVSSKHGNGKGIDVTNESSLRTVPQDETWSSASDSGRYGRRSEDLMSSHSHSDKLISRHGAYKHTDGTVRRLKANTIVEPLPEFLEAYRRELVVFMISSFAVIILTTIVEDIISGVLQPPIN